MKVFKHRNLMSIIYCTLLALPLFAIFGRVGYTIVNKNAKDSYSGEQYSYVESYSEYTNNYDKTYTITCRNNYLSYDLSNNTSTTLFLDEVNVISSTLPSNIENCNNIVLYLFNGNTNSIYFDIRNDTTTIGNTYSSTNSFTITCKILNIQNETNFNTILQYNKFLSYQSNNNTLDNAFSYSVSQIIDNNNFGEINFVGLFSDLFLDQTNSVNALYLNFANWYMNYTLFISVVYILFLVLMWFIQFIRKLLEKGMSFGDRGW